jgi:CSLREA domain-containing protein
MSPKTRCWRAAVCGIALCLSLDAAAATFVVNSTEDLVDLAPGDGDCNARPTGGPRTCTLRAAVQEANALAGDDVVLLPAGTYPLSLPPVAEDPSAGGALFIAPGPPPAWAGDALSIVGQGADETRIRQTAGDRVLVVDVDADASLADLVVAGGDVPAALGGGILNRGALSLERVRVVANVAGAGAGIANLGGTLRIDESEISGNAVEFLVGGGGPLLAPGALVSAELGRPSSSLSVQRSTVGPNAGLQEVLLDGEATFVDSTIAALDEAREKTVWVLGGAVHFHHVTLRGSLVAGEERPGTPVGEPPPPASLTVRNSAVEGCAFGAQPFTLALTGVNASPDASCGFAAAGGILAPLRLLAIRDNGGSTPTLLPRIRSPLIDAADASHCTSTDQRGVARPVDGDGSGAAACDIGAVEAPEAGGLPSACVAALALGALRRRARAASLRRVATPSPGAPGSPQALLARWGDLEHVDLDAHGAGLEIQQPVAHRPPPIRQRTTRSRSPRSMH